MISIMTALAFIVVVLNSKIIVGSLEKYRRPRTRVQQSGCLLYITGISVLFIALSPRCLLDVSTLKVVRYFKVFG